MQVNNIIIEKGKRYHGSYFAFAYIPMEDFELPEDGEVWVGVNFDCYRPPIGTAKVYIKNDVIMADFNLSDDPLLLDLYPAVVLRSRVQENPIAVKYKLESISLCSSGNQDPTIKKLSEQ